METIKGIIAFIVMVAGVLVFCAMLAVSVQAQTQSLEGEQICTDVELIAKCTGQYPHPNCPWLNIPRSQYAEIASHLPSTNGCFMRPMDLHTVVHAYRSMWQECIDTYAEARTAQLVEIEQQARTIKKKDDLIRRLRGKCNSRCRSVR